MPLNQPIEEAPAARRALDEQPVHHRGQPGHRQKLAERRLAAARHAVDAQHPALRPVAVLALQSGAHRDRPGGGLDGRRDRPPGSGCLALDTRDVTQPGAAQAASGRQERERLEQVGLAGAVGPGQHHDPPVQPQIGAGVGAEILELEPDDRRDASRGIYHPLNIVSGPWICR